MLLLLLLLLLLFCGDLVQSRAVNVVFALSTGVVVALGLVSHLQQDPQSAGDVPPPHAFPGDGVVLRPACQADPQARPNTASPAECWTVAVLPAETSL